jgi:hypothetical protein
MGASDPLGDVVVGGRARKPVGVARVRQPVREGESRVWRARYVDLDGVVRQGGRFDRKADAVAFTADLVERLNREGRRESRAPTLVEFLEQWPQRFPRHPRTQATNTERIRHYLLPLLPDGGHIPLDAIRRADLRDAQDALLRRRLAKTTIDGAFSALSALMRDAVDIELIDAIPRPGSACAPPTRAWTQSGGRCNGALSRRRRSARSSPPWTRGIAPCVGRPW